MWLIAGFVALLIGAAFGNFATGMALGGVVAFVTYFFRTSAKGDVVKPTQTQADTELDKQSALVFRIDKLESRVRELERQWAASGAKPVADESPVAVPVDPELTSENPSLVPKAVVSPATKLQQRSDTTSNAAQLSAALAQQAAIKVAARPSTPAQPAISTAPTKPTAPIKPAKPVKTLRERMPEWAAKLVFGGNSLVKVGVLILFLGLAFLLRYAADRVTVSIEFRYVGVLSMGMVLLAVGWLLRDKRRDYAHILQGAGIAVLYLTVLGAMKLHHLIPLGAGFAVLAVVAVLAAALAVLQDALALALMAVLGGFAAPILVSTGGSRPAPLLTYMAFLDVGILMMAWFKSWRILNVLGFTASFALASGWASRNYRPSDDLVLHTGVVFFFLLFTAVATLFAKRSLQEAQSMGDESDSSRVGLGQRALASIKAVGRVDSALVFGLPFAAFGLEYQLTKTYEFVPAFVAIGFALFYLILAKFVLARDSKGLHLLAEAFAVVGVIFATLSIPLGLEGLWTGAAWAVEGAGMYWLGIRQNRPYARMFAFAVMAGAAWKLLQDTAMAQAPEVSVLTGSNIGPVLVQPSSASGSMGGRCRALAALAGGLFTRIVAVAVVVAGWRRSVNGRHGCGCFLGGQKVASPRRPPLGL
jgi:uncharacterized membrane protein